MGRSPGRAVRGKGACPPPSWAPATARGRQTHWAVPHCPQRILTLPSLAQRPSHLQGHLTGQAWVTCPVAREMDLKDFPPPYIGSDSVPRTLTSGGSSNRKGG